MAVDLHAAATLISLVSTPPTIIASCMVVWLWLPAAHRAAWKARRKSTDWFLMGVALGFMGSAGDNAYWAIAWTADFLDLGVRDQLFAAGVYSNVPFRQAATFGAAACHIRAAVKSDSPMFRAVIYGSWIVGLIYGAVLVVMA